MDHIPPPYHTPKPPRSQTPQHLQRTTAPHVLSSSPTVETKPSFLPTHPAIESGPYCQCSDYIVHASNPNKPKPPTNSCTTINESQPPRSSCIQILRISSLVTPASDSIHFPNKSPPQVYLCAFGAGEIANNLTNILFYFRIP
jgi:hypothetical protein